MQVMLVGRAIMLRDGEVLLAQRSLDDPNNPGKWEVPGGKVDQGESLLEATLREAGEEVGDKLRLQQISLPMAGETYYLEDVGRYAGMLYLPFYTIFEAQGEATLGTEHCNLRWFTIEQALMQRQDISPSTLYMLVRLKKMKLWPI